MKTRKQNMQGISLIVLVITIIVMIILAGAVVVTLSNSGIISKANDAVDMADLANVQDLATMLWADAYLDRVEDIEQTVIEGLTNAGIDVTDYAIWVTDSGVTVVRMPEEWKANVSTIVDGVPIPKGFVVSPYAGENTKNGGLVIYELNDKDIADETQFDSWTTRNQYVWVPVDNFETEFVRQHHINTSSVVDLNNNYYDLGTADKAWEVMVNKTTNMPDVTANTALSDFITITTPADGITNTLSEVQAMYASVKEYGGFYIARYEAGLDETNLRDSEDDVVVKTLVNVHSKMNKIPYNFIKWSTSDEMDVDTGAAVEVARSLYPVNDETNKTGVVSTLTYGVQWDRTVQWYIDTKAMKLDEVTKTVGSTAYGNYLDHDITEYTELNKDAKYSDDYSAVYKPITNTYSKGTDTTDVAHILTTGALKAAKINNIYDMAGNMHEWTMEGHAPTNRVVRGGNSNTTGTVYTVSNRYGDIPNGGRVVFGFRTSLYIKK